MSIKINCNAKQTYQVEVKVPALTTGLSGAPALGAVTGIKLRFSTTATGLFLHANLNDLAASERSGKPGWFYVEVSQALHQAHLLTLGVGADYYGIWYRSTEFDDAVAHFVVTDRDIL